MKGMNRLLIVLILCFGSTQAFASQASLLIEPYYNVSHQANVQYRKLAHQLKRNQQKWYKKRLRHYSFKLKRQCHCAAKYRKPIKIIVKNGKIQSAKSPGGANPWRRAKTIDGLFAIIRDAINKKAAGIDVKYHRTYGYPTSIYIDHNHHVADEETSYTIHNLKSLDQNVQKPGGQGNFTFCRTPRPQFCTRDYRPVCGVTRSGKRITGSNACSACGIPGVIKHKPGACSLTGR